MNPKEIAEILDFLLSQVEPDNPEQVAEYRAWVQGVDAIESREVVE